MTFETFIMMDWSGGNDRGPKPKADAIWAGVEGASVGTEQVYLRNRLIAESWLSDILQQERNAGRRVMVGFDFPFGYPGGFPRALTGSDDPLAVWDWFARRVEDTPKHNNRFDLAGQINRAVGQGEGPFWGNGLQRNIKGLLRRKQGYTNPFPDRRHCESLANGTFTCWQLAGAGAVGSQVIMGLPVLARLREKYGAAVWPFEPLDTDIAFVEIWPSLTVGPAPDGMIKDQWQVAEIARQLAALEAPALAAMLDVDAPEEGWIFGLGFEDDLRGAPPLRNDCFALPQGVHWTPAADALQMLKDRLRAVTGIRAVPLHAALGRIAANDTQALRANPPLPNTAVDGYGFSGARAKGVHCMPLVPGRAAAGDMPGRVPAGHAIRVLTGAALPDGVDTVILQEDVKVTDQDIRFNGPVKQGANTRRAGEDVETGETIVRKGRRIRATDLAILAATGVAEIPVYQKLRVGVLSTGDELSEPGTETQPGQIFDANRPMLLGLATQWGHEAVDLGCASDDRATVAQMLDQAADRCDVIVTSGGASAGDEDHLAALLTEAGAMDLWRIAIKPGRPLALGMWQGKPVFGLPGNPVAAMVCALIFARPAMAVLSGADWPEPQGFPVPAAFEKSKKAGRREYLRARITNGRAEVFASEGSGRISGLSWAEGLVELDEDARRIAPGDPVRFVPWGSFGL